MLNRELREFSPMLAAKPQLVAVNKLDTTETRELQDVIEEELRRAMDADEYSGVPGEVSPIIHFISAVSGEGVDGLLSHLASVLAATPKDVALEDGADVVDDDAPTPPVQQGRQRLPPLGFYLDGDVYVVESERLERLTARADMRDYRVLLQLWREMTRIGIAKKLEQAGIEAGDTIRIGKAELEWF